MIIEGNFKMKNKERKNIAKKIAQAEMILQNSQDLAEKAKAEKEIVRLCSQAKSMEDIEIIDEMVQEFLAKGV